MPAPKSGALAELYKNVGLDPAQISGWADQEGGLLEQYGESRALLRADRGRLRQAFRQTKRDIKTQRKFDYSAAAGAANDRGVLGSSADVTARQDVLSGAASARLAARDEFRQGVVQNQQQKLAAHRDLITGLASLQGQRAAAQSNAALQAYIRKAIDRATGGGGGGTAAAKGRWVRKLAGAQGMVGLAKRIERLGGGGLFDVAELENFQGGVTGPHSGPESDHHNGTAFDVNTLKKNNTPYEYAKLRKLYASLKKAGYGYLFEQVTPVEKNRGQRGKHGHYDFTRRRWVGPEEGSIE